MQHPNDDSTYRTARQVAKHAGRAINAGTHRDLLSMQAVSLAPVAVAALVPMAIVAGPALALVALFGVLAGGATVASQQSER